MRASFFPWASQARSTDALEESTEAGARGGTPPRGAPSGLASGTRHRVLPQTKKRNKQLNAVMVSQGRECARAQHAAISLKFETHPNGGLRHTQEGSGELGRLLAQRILELERLVSEATRVSARGRRACASPRCGVPSSRRGGGASPPGSDAIAGRGLVNDCSGCRPPPAVLATCPDFELQGSVSPRAPVRQQSHQ